MDIATIVIFSVLVVVLFSFFLGQFIWGFFKKKKLKKEQAIFVKEADQASKIIIFLVAEIIDQNQKKLENFQVSIGKYKMNEINNKAKQDIKKILSSENYKKYFKSEENLSESKEKNDFYFDSYLLKLYNTKSNLWNKRCDKEIEYFIKSHKEIKSLENYSEIKELALKELSESAK